MIVTGQLSHKVYGFFYCTLPSTLLFSFECPSRYIEEPFEKGFQLGDDTFLLLSPVILLVL